MAIVMKCKLGLGPNLKKLLLHTPSDENITIIEISHTVRTNAVIRLSLNMIDGIMCMIDTPTNVYTKLKKSIHAYKSTFVNTNAIQQPIHPPPTT
jgi:hypothetical protein